jgi:hypothetical protein
MKMWLVQRLKYGGQKIASEFSPLLDFLVMLSLVIVEG